ncbi:winged helix DNA-binding domain-containing protein [Crossiella cryophila]|uniref:Winged helix DNA-binding domain-containing protein n=1 Tax=Crossiella cryophila TaxID=43355 RepID=A0A7W7CB09_9PSEU|nr:winged helix DNA-binding domain-containing protein [Crossiella cryophila]MBB4677845.1 hypothetical protein [Crossiella cryophila]
MDIVTRGRLNRATLARQHLLSRDQVSAVDLIERLCGIQAQEARPPFVALWTRIAGFKKPELHNALHERTIVRATLMRGTLHLMSAADFLRFRHTLQPMLTASLRVLGSRANGLDLDRLLPTARAILATAPRSFTELRPLLQEAFPAVNDRALGYAVRTQLPLVMRPTQDRWSFPTVAAFTLADEWLPEPLSTVDATDQLALRYLGAFGPASAQDFQTWSGLGEGKQIMERLRHKLEVFQDESGRELFDLPEAPRPDEDVPAPVRYLPEFDNLVLAHSDRTRVLADNHRGEVVTKNLRVRATFLVDGYVRGVWETTRKKDKSILTLRPFLPLPRPVLDELVEEGEALLRFQEPDAGTVEVTVAP